MENSDREESNDSQTRTSSSELAMSFDEAVQLHYEGMYESDISKWKDTVLQRFWDTYPDIMGSFVLQKVFVKYNIPALAGIFYICWQLST